MSDAVNHVEKEQNKISGLGKINLRGHLNYREIISRFERQSTFHGISHAALAPNTKWRVIWYTAFTVCLCALLIQIFVLIRRYRTYAKTVDLDLKFENAPFPSVTLCNLNPYKASAINAEPITRATMEAFKNKAEDGGQSYGIAAAIQESRETRAKRSRKPRELSNESKMRRYHQAYARCVCEMDTLTGERKKGSCYSVFKGNISMDVLSALHNYQSTRCICQLDWVSKTLWPCFPHTTWKERMCAECSEDLGHCPMIFFEGNRSKADIHKSTDVCLCHKEYNHCIASNENGYIIEIDPNTDLSNINFAMSLPINAPSSTTTTTTTLAPEVRKAFGFEDLKDELAINTQAQANTRYAVGSLPQEKKEALSQSKHEFILRCSFNQRDCDIENDFKLYYDQTYGNCFTFNWDRTKPVTTQRAGANYGLKVMLYANVSEYLETTEAVGFRITVHDKWIAPFPDAFGYSAPTGFLSSYGVRMKHFHRIPAPHGQCLEGGQESPDFVYTDFNYSVEACQRSCTQKEVIKMCGCGDPAIPIPKGVKPCSVSDHTARACVENVTHHRGTHPPEHSSSCVCHQPCRETNYVVTYSAARWPSGNTRVQECKPRDALCMERYRKNAAMIQIFYEELNFETLSESPAYTLASALADLGGLTGLWIGASVVSLLEIVALIVYTVQAYVRKKRKASNSSSNQVIHPMIYKKYSKDELDKQLGPLADVSAEEDEDEEPPRRKETGYIAPGEELPCDCIYDETGRIKYMKALCPEHGYLVRRGAGFHLYGDDYDEDEEEEEEDPDEEEDCSPEERRKAAEERAKKLKTKSKSRSSNLSNV